MPTSADAHRSGDRLAGRTVLLQGATGTVGSAVLRRLCDQGANVAVAVRKDWQVRRLKAALPPASAVGLVPSGDAEAAAGLVKGVEDWLGPIDALISTVGAFARSSVMASKTGDDLRLMQACFHAVHDLARAVVPPMVRRKTGNLVFTGARAVGESIPELSLYLAAKSALHAYAGCLAAELAPAGIAVTVVAPGEIDADLDRASTPDPDRSDRVSVEAVVDALLAASLARVGGAGVVSVVEPPAAGDARS